MLLTCSFLGDGDFSFLFWYFILVAVRFNALTYLGKHLIHMYIHTTLFAVSRLPLYVAWLLCFFVGTLIQRTWSATVGHAQVCREEWQVPRQQHELGHLWHRRRPRPSLVHRPHRCLLSFHYTHPSTLFVVGSISSMILPNHSFFMFLDRNHLIPLVSNTISNWWILRFLIWAQLEIHMRL